jgi:hypothetical protein
MIIRTKIGEAASCGLAFTRALASNIVQMQSVTGKRWAARCRPSVKRFAKGRRGCILRPGFHPR